MFKVVRLLVVPGLLSIAMLAPAAISPRLEPAAMAVVVDQKFPTAPQAYEYLNLLLRFGYNPQASYVYYAGNGWYGVHAEK